MPAGELPSPISDASALFLHSSLREKVLEHLFVGELLKLLWKQGRRDIEVLRTEVDASGYDLVLECAGVMRHVQLKSSHRSAQTKSVNISVKLGEKPAGCVIWMEFEAGTLEMGPYWWLGGNAGQGLPLAGYPTARHTRAGAGGIKRVRSGLRVVQRKHFQKIETLEEIIGLLFGQ